MVVRQVRLGRKSEHFQIFGDCPKAKANTCANPASLSLVPPEMTAVLRSSVYPLTYVLVYLVHEAALGVHICNEGDADESGLPCGRGQSPSFVPGDT